MKTGIQHFFLLPLFFLLMKCSIQEDEKESTTYKLQTEVWPSEDNGKIIPSQGDYNHSLSKLYMQDQSLDGYLIVGKV